MSFESELKYEAELLKKYHTMSAKEEEYWRPFLLARSGYSCSNCHNPVEVLISQDNARRIKFKLPARKLPVLIIDHIDGDSRFTDDRYGTYGGNLQLLCYSCNRKKAKTQSQLLQIDRMNTTDCIRINREKMPALIDWIKERVNKFDHICWFSILSDGCKAIGINQYTVNRNLDSEFGPELGLFEEFEYADVFGKPRCEITKCDGTHIAFKGHIPRSMTDEDAIKKEQEQKIFFLDPHDDGDPNDACARTLDSYIINQRLPHFISTEFDVAHAFVRVGMGKKLDSHIEKYFTTLVEEARILNNRFAKP